MNTRQLFRMACAASGLLLMSALAPAFAHAMLEASTPANQAVLASAPLSIDLRFAHPTRLVLLKLFRGKEAVPLATAVPAAESAQFSVPLPALAAGPYQAQWSTLSADGHPMKGSISFTVSGK